MSFREQLENLPENILEQFCCAATGLAVCLCIGFPVPIILMYRFVLLITHENEHYETWNVTVTAYNFTCPIVTYLDGEDRPCCACDREQFKHLYFGHCCDRDSAASSCLATSCSAVNPSKGLHFFLVVVMITLLLLCIACFAWMCDKTVQTAVQIYNAHIAAGHFNQSDIQLASINGDARFNPNSRSVNVDQSSMVSQLTTNNQNHSQKNGATTHETQVYDENSSDQQNIMISSNELTIDLPVFATISMENLRFVPNSALPVSSHVDVGEGHKEENHNSTENYRNYEEDERKTEDDAVTIEPPVLSTSPIISSLKTSQIIQRTQAIDDDDQIDSSQIDLNETGKDEQLEESQLSKNDGLNNNTIVDTNDNMREYEQHFEVNL